MDDDRANADDGMHVLLFGDGGEISRKVGWHRRPWAKDLRETDAIFSATHHPIATDRGLGRRLRVVEVADGHDVVIIPSVVEA